MGGAYKRRRGLTDAEHRDIMVRLEPSEQLGILGFQGGPHIHFPCRHAAYQTLIQNLLGTAVEPLECGAHRQNEEAPTETPVHGVDSQMTRCTTVFPTSRHHHLLSGPGSTTHGGKGTGHIVACLENLVYPAIDPGKMGHSASLRRSGKEGHGAPEHFHFGVHERQEFQSILGGIPRSWETERLRGADHGLVGPKGGERSDQDVEVECWEFGDIWDLQIRPNVDGCSRWKQGEEMFELLVEGGRVAFTNGVETGDEGEHGCEREGYYICRLHDP